MFRFILIITLSFFLIHCTDDLPKSSTIEWTRVIGAKLIPEGNPERSMPFADEEFLINFKVVSPDAIIKASWAFMLCQNAPSRYGVPFCKGDPIGFSFNPMLTELVDHDINTNFHLPANTKAASEFLVMGSICFDGPINDDHTSTKPCKDEDGKGTLIRYTFLSGKNEASANHHPQIDRIELDDDKKTKLAAATLNFNDEACAKSSLPKISKDKFKDGLIIKIIDSMSRERYKTIDVQTKEEIETQETYQISLFSNYGNSSPRFAFISDDENEEEITLFFNDVDVNEKGKLIHLYITLRDDRDGFQFIQRNICLIP